MEAGSNADDTTLENRSPTFFGHLRSCGQFLFMTKNFIEMTRATEYVILIIRCQDDIMKKDTIKAVQPRPVRPALVVTFSHL